MQELLKLSEETDIDALSKPTRALVINFPDEIMPFACDISSQMVSSVVYAQSLLTFVFTR